MTGKRILVTLSALMIFTLTGCEKYLEYEGEDAIPRLVLNGTFSPDSAFSVELSNSQGYISNGSINTIPYGKVAVYSANDEFIDSLHHSGNGIYQSSAIAEPGTVYTVRASAGTLGSLSASDFAPVAVPIANWDTTTVSITEYDYTTNKIQVDYTINDPSNAENFYIVEVYRTESYYLDYQYDPITGTTIIDTIYYDEPYSYLTGFSTSDPILLSEVELSLDETLYYANSLPYSDEVFNGNTQTFSILVDPYYSQSTGAILELRLTTCSEAYYKYTRTLQSYYNTEGDPFAQPVQVFTNIENGGLGIWAGSSSFSVEIGN